MTACPICRTDAWVVAYEGPIRDGAWPKTVPGVVRTCSGCGVARLDDALAAEAFASGEYWDSVGAGAHAEGWSGREEMLRPDVAAMWQPHVNGTTTVADIGCGPGAFLDYLHDAPSFGRPATALAIDWDNNLQVALASRGYKAFPTPDRAARYGYQGAVNIAFVLNTLEHNADPVAILRSVRDLLAPDGLILLSTSNRQDVLLDIAPAYPSFFYRRAQRWYFDMPSLAACAAAVGLEAAEARFVQRYGVNNAAGWQVDGKPTGAGDPHERDDDYRRGLEAKGISDRFYVLLRRKA